MFLQIQYVKLLPVVQKCLFNFLLSYRGFKADKCRRIPTQTTQLLPCAYGAWALDKDTFKCHGKK